ncbi:PREDICTED: alpha-1,4-N-acetylglucosaminyltransferase-like [Nanorana parkeri]|uniref:alpha-1,4-N-acetylglucosaminyltransferase-like n=1 Tax=Nanorana parkeri TaxID=125878 RepID=UPI000854C2F8|nr:PREDICTED: alpha-1,4-N-acetylglucosaminyltransferase-like [Nanorana parkeri]
MLDVWSSVSNDRHFHGSTNVTYKPITQYTILNKGNGILFMETTDRMEPPSLVLCSIESAARVYPDRPVVFFMKGLEDIITEEDEHRVRKHFPTLSSFDNIYFFPLRMEELFMYTPLMTWYKKVNPQKEKYWTHVISDACRFAMIWKHGGIYMDTDVISICPIPKDHFVAAESPRVTSGGVFGLPPFHSVSWEFMENFVVEYKGWKWGHNGPGVFTRVIKKLCGEIVFTFLVDTICANMSYFHPHRFYPILYTSWQKYFEVSNYLPTFTDSYGLHLWNYKNKNGLTMVPGSNTLVEHLYKKYCPSTYEAIVRNERLHV